MHTLSEARLIPHDARGRLVGEFLWSDIVLQAQLGGVHAEPPGSPVHESFHDERRDGTPNATVWPHGGFAGSHPSGSPSVVRDAVRSRQKADRLDRFDRRRPRVNRVRPDIRGHLSAQAHDGAISLQRQLCFDNLVPGLGRGQQIFTPVADPLHRPGEQPCNDTESEFLGVERRLGAEAAAHVGGHHPHAVFGKVEEVGQNVAQ